MKSFSQIHNFKNLLDKPTCYKIPTNPSCADLFITNKPRSFQNSRMFETRLSDIHNMTLTVLKSSFAKQKPRILIHHNYRFFNDTLFRDQVLNKLRNSNLQISDKDLKHFKETCLSVVNTIAPLKSRSIRVNHVRPKLRKKFLKSRSVSDKKVYGNENGRQPAHRWFWNSRNF